MFCNCYCLSTSTSTICVGFIRPEIRELALTYSFIQATHKIYRSVSITSHADVNFYYQGYFSNIIQVQHERKHSASRTSEKETQLECCYKFSIFAFFQAVFFTQTYGFDGRRWTLHKQQLSCKNVQTLYAQCQNYTLLRIPEDNHRIISTHICTHTLSKWHHIYTWWIWGQILTYA